MTIKYTAVIEVDVVKLKGSTDYQDIDSKDKKFLTQLVETEFNWIAPSGIRVRKLKLIK